MRKSIPVLVPLLLLVGVTGCIDSDQEYTLNPDGSGKVLVKWTSNPIGIQLGNQNPDPEESTRKAIRETLKKSEGVETWKNVTCTTKDDGKISFQGTAYFRSLGGLKLHTAGLSGFGNPTFSRDARGRITVGMTFEKDEGKKPTPESPQLNKAEVAKLVRAERAKYQQMKPMLATFLSELRIRKKFHLPARIESSTNFKKPSDRSVEIALEGNAFLKLMDKVVKDDEWMSKLIRDGGTLQGGAKPDNFLMEQLFGQKGPVRAVSAATAKPLFNYAAEVAAAKKRFKAFATKFGGSLRPPPPPARGGGFTSLKVAGVQVVYLSDNDRGVRPFHENSRGLKISLLGELPGSVLSVKKTELQKAIADTGENLMTPKGGFVFFGSSGRLTEDKSGVVFEVSLKLPGDNVKRIREISGKVEYLVAQKTNEVDLGFAELKAGARGKAYGARIKKIEGDSFRKDHQSLSLKLELKREEIKSVEFLDGAGKKLHVSSAGWSSSGDRSTLSYRTKGAFPQKGRIVVSVFDDLRTHEIPFSIRDVDLLGRPSK